MKDQISNISPESIKKVYRLFRYPNERKKFIREIGIRKKQDELFKQHYRPDTVKLIIFIVPGADWATGKDTVSGGVMSIVSICEETSAMKDAEGFATIMCTLSGDHLMLKHHNFDNNTIVYRFSQIISYFKQVKEILIHVPEYMTLHFMELLSKAEKYWLREKVLFHINIMNQNIRLMPEPLVIDQVRKLGGTVTITTAHQKYCSPYYRAYFGVPIHKLSVWISPEQYNFKIWEEKENLMVVSPDGHPEKEIILKKLASVKGLTIQIIQGLTYKEYKELISRAKWTLTFGEGLDGYLIEPVFSGAIGFAVYNEIFFTPDFKEQHTVYESMEALIAQINTDITALNNQTAFVAYQQQQYDLCAKYYSKAQYIKNIAAFYKGEYTYA